MKKIMIACASALMMLLSTSAYADGQTNPPPQASQSETQKECKKGEGKCKKEGECKKEGKCSKGRECKNGKGKRGEGKCNKGEGRKQNHGRRMEGRVSPKQILSSLDLTPEQTKKVEALCAERKAKMESRMAEKTRKAEQERLKEQKNMEKEMKGFEAKLEKILSPEQFASFKAKMAEEKKAMQKDGKRFGKELREGRKCCQDKADSPKDGIGEIKRCPVQQPM